MEVKLSLYYYDAAASLFISYFRENIVGIYHKIVRVCSLNMQ